MTVRRNSIRVYHEIEAEGLLSKRRWEVYSALFKHGPCTANELYRQMKAEGHVSVKNQQANLTPRLGELRELGCVYEVRKRPCNVTGRKEVIEFDVTDRRPEKPWKPAKHKCPHCDGKGFVA